MRAALIKAFGEPTEVLELADVPEPSGPAAGEVGCRVRADWAGAFEHVWAAAPACDIVRAADARALELAAGSGRAIP